MAPSGAACGYRMGRTQCLFARNQLAALVQPELEVSATRSSTPCSGRTCGSVPPRRRRTEGTTPGRSSKRRRSCAPAASCAALRQGPAAHRRCPEREGARRHEPVRVGDGRQKADLFLTYCTNAVLPQGSSGAGGSSGYPRPCPSAPITALWRSDASGEAWRRRSTSSPAGQKTLSDYGFEAAAMPRGSKTGRGRSCRIVAAHRPRQESAGIQLPVPLKGLADFRGPGVRAERREQC